MMIVDALKSGFSIGFTVAGAFGVFVGCVIVVILVLALISSLLTTKK